MGIIWVKQAFKKIFDSKKDVKLLMLGLDGAGKTTTLYQMKINTSITTIPTIGFNLETVSFKNINFTIWDVGGQDKIRKLWRHYYNTSTSLIFVIDSADHERLEEAFEELQLILSDSEMEGKPVLILANKQDRYEALSTEKIYLKFKPCLQNREWKIQPCCATNGEGLYEGMEWISRECTKN